MAQACQRDMNTVDMSKTHSQSRLGDFQHVSGVDHAVTHSDRLSDPTGMYRSVVLEHPLGPGTYNLPMASRGEHKHELMHHRNYPGAASPGAVTKLRTAADTCSRTSNFGSETLRFDATASQREMRTLGEVFKAHELGPGTYHQINNNLGSHKPYQPRSSTASRIISAPIGAALGRSKRELSDASLEFQATAPGTYDLPSAFAPRGSRRLLMKGSQHGTCSFLSSGRHKLLTPDAGNFIVTPESGRMFNGQQLGPGSYNLPMCTRGEHKREIKHSFKPPSAEHHGTTDMHSGGKEDEFLHAGSAAKAAGRRKRRPEAPEVHDDWVHEVMLVRTLPNHDLPPDTP